MTNNDAILKSLENCVRVGSGSFECLQVQLDLVEKIKEALQKRKKGCEACLHFSECVDRADTYLKEKAKQICDEYKEG